MKPIIIAFAITSAFASCNSKSPDQGKNVVGVDTAGSYKINIVADTAQAVLAPGTTTKKVVETHSPDGSVTTTTTTTSADKPVVKPKAPTGSRATVKPVTATTAQPAAATVTKKGWSSRAKGAAIGGVGGAVAGAVISKKKGKGAIIGGLAGAAGGYIIGNEKDKKKGR